MSFQFIQISQYHQHLRQGRTTCVQAVIHYLQQIELNKKLNAFVAVFGEEVLEKAAKLDEERASGKPMGPLHGVIIALKDVICYEGHVVSAGSKMLENFESVYSATAVQKLIDADALIIGNCNCDEFAMGSTNENSVHGPVLNADDHTRVPGGSSGGSAVAVQSGQCMVSLGSDTGGSVRQPADFCGIVGLKPTYGRISRYGLIAYASSFDQIGIFGNNVADIALVFKVIAGYDPKDSTSPANQYLPEPAQLLFNAEDPKTYKFAYLAPTMELPGLDPEIKTTINRYFETLKLKGHRVDAIPFEMLDYIVPTYYVLTTAEASSNLSRFDGVRFGHHSDNKPKDLTEYYKQNRSEGFGVEVKRRIILGSFVLSAGYYDAYFGKAQQVRRLICDQTAAIFEQYDAIIMPVSPTTAFALGEKINDPVAMYLADIYTVFANLAGLPGMSLPLFSHTNGMNFGVQLLTKRWDDVLLHQISSYLIAENK